MKQLENLQRNECLWTAIADRDYVFHRVASTPRHRFETLLTYSDATSDIPKPGVACDHNPHHLRLSPGLQLRRRFTNRQRRSQRSWNLARQLWLRYQCSASTMSSRSPSELYKPQSAQLVSSAASLHSHPSNQALPSSCCPSNNVCSYANGIVACCPQGQTCTGYAQPSQWQPPPATTYYQPPTPTTVYAGVAGGYIAPAAKPTTVYNNPPQFCRTIYAHGPGLPTTQPGDCGTILIVEGGSGRVGIDWRTIMIATGMPMLGAMVLAWRR